MKARVLIVLAAAAAVVLLSGPSCRAPAADPPRPPARPAGVGVVLTPRQERDLGKRYLESFPEATRRGTDGEYAADVLRRVVAPLGPTEYSFRVYVDPDPNPAAAGLPGGFLVITKGLLQLVRFEAELGVVLAHEVIHAHKNHWRDALKAHTAREGLPGPEPPAPDPEWIRAVLELGFSEAQELEADRAGVQLAAAAGYAPRAAERLLARLAALRLTRLPPSPILPGQAAELARAAVTRFFQSHPAEARRLEAVQRSIRDHRDMWEVESFFWGKGNLQRREARTLATTDPEEFRHLNETVED